MESERPIEKVLRAAAKKRRSETESFCLHPATRRLLQAEAARQYPTPRGARTGLLTWVLPLWPRLVPAIVILAVLGTAVWLAVPPRQPDLHTSLSPTKARSVDKAGTPEVRAGSEGLAEKEKKVAETTRAASPSEQTHTPLSVAEAKNDSTQSLADEMESRRQETTPAPVLGQTFADSGAAPKSPDSPATAALSTSAVPAGTLAMTEADRLGYRLSRDRELANKPETAAAPTPAAAPKAEAAASTLAGRAALPESEQFRHFAARGGMAPSQQTNVVSNAPTPFVRTRVQVLPTFQNQIQVSPPEPLLASFEVEQQGRELRIIDNDGSVYQGVVSTNADSTLPQADSSNAGYQMKGASPLVQNYNFRVAGTNRTLRQNVVFYGNYSQLPTTLAEPATTQQVNQTFRGAKAGLAVQQQMGAGSRISGRAVLENGKELKVDALSNQR